MKVLSKQQVLVLQQQLIEQAGGTPGVRDEGLLESALSAPFQGFGDAEVYPSLSNRKLRGWATDW